MPSSSQDKTLSAPRSNLFQKPGAPKKITITNPSTGQALSFPSPQKSDQERILKTSISKLPPTTDSQPTQLNIQADGNVKENELITKSSASRERSKKAQLSQSYANQSEIKISTATKSQSPKRSSTALTSNIKEEEQNREPEASSKKKAPQSEHSSGWKPDIYVHAYVPRAFLAVNEAPAILLSSTPVNGVNFKTYTSAFGAPYFLGPLEVALPPPTYSGASVSSLQSLHVETYKVHQLDCLILDLEAQIPEIRTYDMFGVQLSVIDRALEIYSVSVPGLREGTPSVAFGDNIMIRQLVMDPRTQLPLAAPASGSTGYQISAVVEGVDKTSEVLTIRANGFTPHLLLCNVSFIVQTRWIKSLQRAVTDIAQELLDSSRQIDVVSPRDDTSSDSPSSDHDYGPIGTPIKIPAMRTRQSSFSKTRSPLKSPLAPRQDHFGVFGTPVRSPTKERLDYFGPMIPVQQKQSGFYFENSQNPKIRFPESPTVKPMQKSSVQASSQGWLRRTLFPIESDGVMQTSLPKGLFNRSWFDRNLNYEQKKAIDAVLRKTYGSIPFLVNGPPGTGKTKTIVEIATQLAHDDEFEGSILLCAPSDPAADTLALRLRHRFPPKVMFRLNDFSRTFAEVPEELLPYCYVEKDIFSLPPLKELMACRIVISTCRAADALIQARVTNRNLVNFEMNVRSALNPHVKRNKNEATVLHWWALLIDEAAQATEPEMLIPLAVVAPAASSNNQPNPAFVMAGDQYQLGPRTYNKSTTLHVSLFERLSSMPLYANHPLARKSISRLSPKLPILVPAFTNLTRNYRSHPAILAIPSSLFYSDTLIPEADAESLERWHGWNNPGWPIRFDCNKGIDDCEKILVPGGGGWYNKREAQKAITCAIELIQNGFITEPSEICIMSPFRAQVGLLREYARSLGFWNLNIGPMEAFQGLESRFVIVCTTRTRKRFLEEDAVRGIGVINEAKKFNVAITRAKEGLIVLGNPWVLERDSHWLRFMNFCWRNQLWQKDEDGPDERMIEAEEADANDWAPHERSNSEIITGLENALQYKNREPAGSGSKAVKRFMSERGEDEIWRSGIMAEATLLEQED
ncbi:MAG: hypothetical protein Q9214_001078 [Letrouitia sp. 1 TL-2023]